MTGAPTTRVRSARWGRRTMGLLAMVLLGACAPATTDSGEGTTALVGDGVRVVSTEEATRLLDADPAPVLIDVRTPAEFAGGHLDGAESVDFQSADFRERIAEYPRDGSYVIYCRSGNRSEGARTIMTELGFTDVADIDGGIVAWTQAGLPVVS